MQFYFFTQKKKNHLNFKGNFYFKIFLNIFISTPLTTRVQRLVVDDKSMTILISIFVKLSGSLNSWNLYISSD